MDLKTFSESDFDAKKWINKAWTTSETADKELFVNNAVNRLQLYMQQLSNSLDETTTQLVSSIPRILSDAATVNGLGVNLSESVQRLQSKVESVETDTGHSILMLRKIDDLKGRLENAATKLREADKWEQLAVSLEGVLESGVPTHGVKLEELTKQVAAMTASLQVLSEAPDYDAKQVQLEALYNRLEASLTPSVITALTQRHAENTAAFEAIFSAMNRHNSLIRYWRRVQADVLQSTSRYEYTVHNLLNDMLAHANLQVDWLTNVLKSNTPLNELVRLYTDLLLSLEPSPVKMLSASLKLCSSPDEAINVLVDYKKDVDDFIRNFKIILDAERKNKEYILPAALKELGRAIYAPLRDALPKYTDLETISLTGYLDCKDTDKEDASEMARFIVSVTEKWEKLFLSSHSQARKIAGNAVYPFYMPAIEAFISAFNSLCSGFARHVESWFLSSSAQGISPGVLWPGFPLTVAVSVAIKTLPAQVNNLATLCLKELETTESDILESVEWLVLDDSGRNMLAELRSGTEVPWSLNIEDARRCDQVLSNLSLTIVVEPIAIQLEKIPHLNVWNDNNALTSDLPDFSISPQEYITVAGQYLMTLPQHLELHLIEKEAPWLFLNEVCSHTCEMYAEKILNIRNMDSLGTKRCLTDIEKIPHLNVWNDNNALTSDLPDFSISPQEYITVAGQYLMTLPQHLELHLIEKEAPWLFLNEVCSHTCEMYAEKILNIRNMDSLGTKRCLTDIVYLSSVLEDLGTTITPALKNLEKSLRNSIAIERAE